MELNIEDPSARDDVMLTGNFRCYENLRQRHKLLVPWFLKFQQFLLRKVLRGLSKLDLQEYKDHVA